MTDENQEIIDVWITKYALSKGIYKVKAARSYGKGIVKEVGEGVWIFHHGEGRDWHRTEEEARKRAEEMRRKRIKSLSAQIEKLKRMTF